MIFDGRSSFHSWFPVGTFHTWKRKNDSGNNHSSRLIILLRFTPHKNTTGIKCSAFLWGRCSFGAGGWIREMESEIAEWNAWDPECSAPSAALLDKMWQDQAWILFFLFLNELKYWDNNGKGRQICRNMQQVEPIVTPGQKKKPPCYCLWPNSVHIETTGWLHGHSHGKYISNWDNWKVHQCS